MRTALVLLLLAGISFGFEFEMNATSCENTPFEIRFNQTNESVCEYYLYGPIGGSHYLGYDYSCKNMSIPWSEVSAMEKNWEGIWNLTVLHSGNMSSMEFEVVKGLEGGSIELMGNVSDTSLSPGKEFNITADWTERCDDDRKHTIIVKIDKSETEIYYGALGERNASYSKIVNAPENGGVYEVQLVHKVGGVIRTLDSKEITVLSSKIEFSGFELSGENNLEISLSNGGEQAIVRDVTIVLKGGFTDITKKIVSPYAIPKNGADIRTSLSKSFRAAGLMTGTGYTAELYAIVDEPGESYLIERNFSGVFGGFCGDEICSGECVTCPKDCGLEDCKGDGVCSKVLGENCGNSPSDCGCKEGEECYMSACVPLREKQMTVNVLSDGIPIEGVLVESPGHSCRTNGNGTCLIYAIPLDVLKASKKGYIEETALASEGVSIDIAVEGTEILDVSQVESDSFLMKKLPGTQVLLAVLGLLIVLLIVKKKDFLLSKIGK